MRSSMQMPPCFRSFAALQALCVVSCLIVQFAAFAVPYPESEEIHKSLPSAVDDHLQANLGEAATPLRVDAATLTAASDLSSDVATHSSAESNKGCPRTVTSATGALFVFLAGGVLSLRVVTDLAIL
eukprot:gnl/MRDRNA2_/MRDRNA2_14880_c0_seq1.p1 gnl/MRDRNA2_/MRDRNA2_14880_c0~~gnl/MRDRNA2_/MRDRNA2_14880_c0_seq1.p1  ORF type:complete len:127 (-),score=20.98 gnl/MRDRNA2_/MRDRNA2_14880_c0_seq1:280-660(-)